MNPLVALFLFPFAHTAAAQTTRQEHQNVKSASKNKTETKQQNQTAEATIQETAAAVKITVKPKRKIQKTIEAAETSDPLANQETQTKAEKEKTPAKKAVAKKAATKKTAKEKQEKVEKALEETKEAPETSTEKPARKTAAKKAAKKIEEPKTTKPTKTKSPMPAMVERERPLPKPLAAVAAPITKTIEKDQTLSQNWKKRKIEDLTDAEVIAMPDDQYMNKTQLAFFRLKLTRLKEGILTKAGQTAENLRDDAAVVPDPADRATIEEEHALELRTRDRERKLLKKIEQAIAKIENKEYGYCEESGEEIGVARLIARPTASLTVEEQQKREQTQKLFGD